MNCLVIAGIASATLCPPAEPRGGTLLHLGEGFQALGGVHTLTSTSTIRQEGWVALINNENDVLAWHISTNTFVEMSQSELGSNTE